MYTYIIYTGIFYENHYKTYVNLKRGQTKSHDICYDDIEFKYYIIIIYIYMVYYIYKIFFFYYIIYILYIKVIIFKKS